MSDVTLLSRRVFGQAAAGLALVAMSSSVQSQELGLAGFESPATLQASEILPPELLESEFHRVVEAVENDGYMNRYSVESEFGEFEAYGRTVLAQRVQEIRALAELDRLTRSEVFVDAVSRSVTSQVATVREFAERPVETLKGVPKGVKRLFKRVRRQARDGVGTVKELAQGSDDDTSMGEASNKSPGGADIKLLEEGLEASQKYARKYLGISGAERRWAEKLGVDPYTTNEVLVREIKRVARVDAGAGLAVRLIPILKIPGVSFLKDVSKLVWRTAPRELRERNKKELAKLGVGDAVVDSFFNNHFYSPTLQTLLVDGLGELDGVKDVSTVLILAALAESPEEALFSFETLRMLVGFHREISPIERLIGGDSLPAALTADDRLVLLVPVEYIFWTEGIAASAGDPFGGTAGALTLGKPREVWFRGRASERFQRELEERGWLVFDQVQFVTELANTL